MDIGSVVTTVDATDEDEGLNGQVQYEFVENPSNQGRDWTKFRIDRNNGVIKTAVEIDREVQQMYFVS